MEAKDPVEEARKENRIEMDARIIRAKVYLDTQYPMADSNTLIRKTDAEVSSYIRMRREEFQAKYAGKSASEIRDSQAEHGITGRSLARA